MTTSVVIPAHNAAATIHLTLEALTRQDYPDFEVVVIDDASTDHTSDKAQYFSSRLNLKIVRCAENLGRARARNFGIEQSSGEVILLLDSDIETIPSYVKTHLELHLRKPRAVGVGALRYPPYLAKRALARYYSSRGGEMLRPGEPLPGKAFVSCLASFRRSLFNEIGGFHEGFRTYGGEDLELGLRLQKSGAAMTYLKTAVGYHHHLRKIKDVVKTLEQYGEQGVPLVLQRHPEFAVDMKLDDLTTNTLTPVALLRRLTSHPFFFYPLLECASRLQMGKLPSLLISYLIYRSYRTGFQRHLHATR